MAQGSVPSLMDFLLDPDEQLASEELALDRMSMGLPNAQVPNASELAPSLLGLSGGAEASQDGPSGAIAAGGGQEGGLGLGDPLSAARQRFQGMDPISRTFAGAGEIAAGAMGRPSPMISREQMRVQGLVNNLHIMSAMMQLGVQGAGMLANVPVPIAEDGTPDLSQVEAAEGQIKKMYTQVLGPKMGKQVGEMFTKYGAASAKALFGMPEFRKLMTQESMAGRMPTKGMLEQIPMEKWQEATIALAYEEAGPLLPQAFESFKRMDPGGYQQARTSEDGFSPEEIRMVARKYGEPTLAQNVEALLKDPVRLVQVFPEARTSQEVTDERARQLKAKRGGENVRFRGPGGEVVEALKGTEAYRRYVESPDYLEVTGQETKAGAAALGFDKATTTMIEKEINALANTGALVTQAVRDFDADLATRGARLKRFTLTELEKIDRASLSDEDRAFITKMTDFEGSTGQLLTETLAQLSGAAVTKQEAERFETFLPKTSDSATQIQTKLRRFQKLTQMAIARKIIALRSGSFTEEPWKLLTLSGVENTLADLASETFAAIVEKQPEIEESEARRTAWELVLKSHGIDPEAFLAESR